MTERKAFVAWLETLAPKLPTTHDVEVAWRAWTARAGKGEGELIAAAERVAERFGSDDPEDEDLDIARLVTAISQAKRSK